MRLLRERSRESGVPIFSGGDPVPNNRSTIPARSPRRRVSRLGAALAAILALLAMAPARAAEPTPDSTVAEPTQLPAPSPAEATQLPAPRPAEPTQVPAPVVIDLR